MANDVLKTLQVELCKLQDWLQEPGASFVTLTQQGGLRGCIGSLAAHRPLLEDVRAMLADAGARARTERSEGLGLEASEPSRLARARLKLLGILERRQSGQTALLVYTANAFTVTPLTDDTDTISHLVPTLDSSLMPAQGSASQKETP